MSYYTVYMTYLVVSALFLAISAIIAGYKLEKLTWGDVFDALVWPVSVLVILGVTIRLIKEKSKEKSKKN